MSSHNDHDHQPTENKPVSFTTPLILALVTLLVILLSVSTCDRKKDCCEGGTCETKCEDKHEAHHGAETKEGHHDAAAVVNAADSVSVAQDTTHTHAETETHSEAHH